MIPAAFVPYHWRIGVRSVSPLHSFTPKHEMLAVMKRAGHALKMFADLRQSRQTGRTPQSAQEETPTADDLKAGATNRSP